MNKSESDQEDNDDLNDNDWSYGAEKKGEQPFDFHLMRSISINLGLFRKITPLSNEPNSLSLQPRREKAKRYILVTYWLHVCLEEC